MRLNAPSLLLLSLTAAPAAAQIVVLDGDDLPAVVTAAPDGETIVINSDATFVGTLSWEDKALTIRGGFGFAPTIKGDVDQNAIDVAPGMDVTLRDLTIDKGDNVENNFTWAAQFVDGISTAPARFEAKDCTLGGGVKSTFGPENQIRAVKITDSSVAGSISIRAYRGQQVFVDLLRSTVDGDVDFNAADSQGGTPSTLDATVQDSSIEFGFEIGSPSSSSGGGCDVAIRRSTLGYGVEAYGGAEPSTLFLESCLLVGPGPGATSVTRTGLTTGTDVTARCINVTVTGFDVGLETNVGTTLDNLAIFGNADDLHPVLLPIQISNSLIEDGTFEGLFGNFAGTPLVDQDYRLIQGSIGIDAGDPTVVGLGTTDLEGQPRIQDGNGDGVARVNVGALETVPACTQAAVEPLLLGGANLQALTASGLPVLGSDFQVEIAMDVTTIATLLAVGLESGVVNSFPGIEGALLLSAAPFPLLYVAAGSHPLPIPMDTNLCGVQLAVQGVRADLVGADTALSFTNGLRLTLGG
jgi:hypothetical protein